MADLRVGDWFEVRLEHPLVPTTVLGWGIVLKDGKALVIEREAHGGHRAVHTPIPENSKPMAKARLEDDHPARLALLAVNLVIFG